MGNLIVASIFVVIVCYLIGSIMTAIKLTAARGRDVRAAGSGNAGATNVMRTLGWRWGLLCMLCDGAKGAIAVATGYAVSALGVHFGLLSEGYELMLMCLGLLGAMAGHLLPIFYNFKGGKCVSVVVGGFLVLAPGEALIGLAFAAVLIAITKMVSVGSVLGVPLCCAIVMIKNWGNTPFCITAATVALVVVIAHIPNIQRILSGNERKIGKKTGQN